MISIGVADLFFEIFVAAKHILFGVFCSLMIKSATGIDFSNKLLGYESKKYLPTSKSIWLW
jgi:hypothetical protein